MDWNTFFLGVIAVCMVIITFGMLMISIFMVLILKVLKDFLVELKLDYKVVSPKVMRILEDVEQTASIFSLFTYFFRRKKKKIKGE